MSLTEVLMIWTDKIANNDEFTQTLVKQMLKEYKLQALKVIYSISKYSTIVDRFITVAKHSSNSTTTENIDFSEDYVDEPKEA